MHSAGVRPGILRKTRTSDCAHTLTMAASARTKILPADVFVDEPWLFMGWDRAHRCVFSGWKGFATSAELRAGMMKIVDAIRERHAASFVSDNRKLEMVANEDQLWIRDTWTPLAVAAGLKRIAVVLAQRGLGKIASEAVLSQIGKTAFVTRTFVTVARAIEWVVGQRVRPCPKLDSCQNHCPSNLATAAQDDFEFGNRYSQPWGRPCTSPRWLAKGLPVEHVSVGRGLFG